MPDDPLLQHYEALRNRVAAWKDAWTRRAETSAASVAQLMSAPYLGETLGQQIETRLLEGRREIDNQIARFAGTVAAGVALLCRAGNTDEIERKTQEAFLAIGRHEDGFETKMAELRPLVELYQRLSTALGRAATA